MFKLVKFAVKGIYSLVRFFLVGSLPPRSKTLLDRLGTIDTKLESIRRKLYYDNPGTHDYSKEPGADISADTPAPADPFAQAFPTGPRVPAQDNSMPKTGDPVL